MKRIILSSMVVLAIVFASSRFKTSAVSPASISEGSITYSTEVKADSGSALEQQAQMMDGMETKARFKAKKFRMDMNMGMMKMSIMTKDGEEIFTLINMMGQKMAIKGTVKEMKKLAKLKGESTEPVNYVATTETKKILGYTCKKYTSTFEADGKKYTNITWATDEISANSGLMNSNAQGLTGFPLETFSYNKGLKTHMLAAKVNKTAPDDADFEVPSGYDVKTIDELMQQMGGGAGE